MSELYFAYGSNLNEQDRLRWCAERGIADFVAEPLRCGLMVDSALAFDDRGKERRGGVLNLAPRRGGLVPGVLMRLRPGGWEALDAREDAPRSSERTRCVVLDREGGVFDAVTYRVAHKQQSEAFVPPTAEALAVLARGLADFQLDDAPLLAAAEGQATPNLVERSFFYGTLRSDGPEHGLVRAALAEPGRSARCRGRLYDLGAYPGLRVSGDADSWVEGEQARLSDLEASLATLDAYEDFLGYHHPDSLYHRVLVTTETREGQRAPAWTYVLAPRAPRGRLIESGRWSAAPA